MFENEMKEILDLVLEISTKTEAKRLVFLQRESCLLYQTESSW